MAPKNKLLRIIPNSSTALKTSISLLVLIVAAGLPFSASAARLVITSSFPDLKSFSSSIQNGSSSVLRGAYADDLFALPIIQQPASDAGYVSSIDNTLTQFRLASLFGNVGLLAHNYLSGEYFSQLLPGMRLELVYGDGHIEYFQISQVYRYRATAPDSVNSDFIDLDTQETISATALFTKVYKGARHVTFQTCISQDGNSSWGRLFVIAEPE